MMPNPYDWVLECISKNEPVDFYSVPHSLRFLTEYEFVSVLELLRLGGYIVRIEPGIKKDDSHLPTKGGWIRLNEKEN